MWYKNICNEKQFCSVVYYCFKNCKISYILITFEFTGFRNNLNNTVLSALCQFVFYNSIKPFYYRGGNHETSIYSYYKHSSKML